MQLITHKFSVKDYHRMGETGILPPDQNFELIHGEIIAMSPVGFKHAYTVRQITALCYQKFQTVISVQDPILLWDNSEPEPDITLLSGAPQKYATCLPTATDVQLLIEVSDSTLRYDQTVKLPLYATNQIPEVWIVNLPAQQLEIYRQPTDSTYTQTLILQNSESIAPLAFPEMAIAVANILG